MRERGNIRKAGCHPGTKAESQGSSHRIPPDGKALQVQTTVMGLFNILYLTKGTHFSPLTFL